MNTKDIAYECDGKRLSGYLADGAGGRRVPGIRGLKLAASAAIAVAPHQLAVQRALGVHMGLPADRIRQTVRCTR